MMLKNRTLIQKVSSLLIDAAVFAYVSASMNFILFYAIVIKFLGRSFDGNCFLPAYFFPNLALLAVSWAVGFLVFLFPLPSILFCAWNIYRYYYFHDAQTQHLILVVGYVLAVSTDVVFRIFWRKMRFSPGNKLWSSAEDTRIAPGSRALSMFVLSELLVAFQTTLICSKDSASGISHKDRSIGKSALLLIAHVALIGGLGFGCLWKLPLQAKAREVEQELPLQKGPEDLSVYQASVCWLYAGNGARAIQLAEAQIRKDLDAPVAPPMEQFDQLVAVIDLADRAGYCTSMHWQKISRLLEGTLVSRFDYTLATYLRDGNERHRLFSQAEKVDGLIVAASLRESGPHSVDFVSKLYDSARFHQRIKDYDAAIKIFTHVIEFCETNKKLSDASDKNFLPKLLSDSRENLERAKASRAKIQGAG
ncbi:MAG: hypothetical protein JNN26_13375 [Candidatus Obscuribacter sp.]|nr:hypothetical protein [Candidatus Obscuribacter sp.]